jgi:hypothetical protein
MTEPSFVSTITPVSHLLLVLHYEDLNATDAVYLTTDRNLYEYLFRREERVFKKYGIKDINDLTSEKISELNILDVINDFNKMSGCKIHKYMRFDTVKSIYTEYDTSDSINWISDNAWEDDEDCDSNEEDYDY